VRLEPATLAFRADWLQPSADPMLEVAVACCARGGWSEARRSRSGGYDSAASPPAFPMVGGSGAVGADPALIQSASQSDSSTKSSSGQGEGLELGRVGWEGLAGPWARLRLAWAGMRCELKSRFDCAVGRVSALDGRLMWAEACPRAEIAFAAVPESVRCKPADSALLACSRTAQAIAAEVQALPVEGGVPMRSGLWAGT